MAFPGVFSAWLSVCALLCACHDQHRNTVPAGFPTLDDIQGPDRFPSAAAAPARTLPAGFPAVDDLRESAWFPSAARAAPARTHPEEFQGFPTLDDLQGSVRSQSAPWTPAGTPSGDFQGFPTLDDLVAPDERAGAKTPDLAIKRPEEHQPEDYHPDLTELILLAGHTDMGGGLRNITLNYFAERRGWEQGVWLTHMEDPANCYFDHALTWRKGTECYAMWSATDDIRDFVMQSTPNMAVDDNGNPNTTQMCGFSINAFVVYQMEGFMRSPEWPDFVNFFADETCETVKSVGHSLGGAMATLFAACANAQAEGFGERHDFGIVTFGAFPVSEEPLYSGTPGTPFSGTRYHISGPEGNGPLRDAKAFRLDILELHRRIAEMTEVSVSFVLGSHAMAIAALPDDEVEPYWDDNKLTELLRPYQSVVARLGLVDGVTDYNAVAFQAVQEYFNELVKKMLTRGDIFYDYDPISQVNMLYGYKHALVDFQPVFNKNNVVALMERVPAELATGLPDVDPWQATLGIAVTGRLPNHYVCCYYRSTSLCPYLFKLSAGFLKSCAATTFR